MARRGWTGDGLADQARHRHHRREPQLRPCVRHLRAEAAGRESLQPALPGRHQARQQQQRASRPQLPEGAPTVGAGCRHDGCVPAQPGETDLPQRPVAGSAGGRSEGLLHSQRVRQHADRQLLREPGAGEAVGIRTGSGLLSVPVDRRHRPNVKDTRPAHQQREHAACGTVSADQQQRTPV
jgi:hypothetical protein